MATHVISVRVRDDAGKVGNIVYYADDSQTLAEITAFLATNLPLLDLVTGAKIEAAGVTLAIDVSGLGLKADALDDHPVNWGANFGFSAANTNYRHTVHVPALDQSLITDGVITDVTSILANWYASLVTGSDGVTPTDAYSNDLTAQISAAPSFRK